MGLENPLHIAVLVVLVLLVFGAKRLPEIGRSLGTGMREFKQSITGESNQQNALGAGPQQQSLGAPAQQAPAQQAPPEAQPAAAAFGEPVRGPGVAPEQAGSAEQRHA